MIAYLLASNLLFISFLFLLDYVHAGMTFSGAA